MPIWHKGQWVKEIKDGSPAPPWDGRPVMLPGDWTDPVIEAERGISDEYVVQTRLNRRRLLELGDNHGI